MSGFDFRTILKAYNLIELQKYKEALITVEIIPIDDPLFEDALHCQFICYTELGQIKKSKKILDLTLNKFPNSAQSHVHLCEYFIDRNDLKAATSAINVALEIEPKNVGNLSQLVSLHIATYQIDKAKKVLRIAEQLDPNSMQVIFAKTKLLASEHQFVLAIKEIKRGLEIEPNNVDFNSLYVELLKRNPETIELAEQTAIHALTIDPTDENARKNLLDVYKNKNGLFRFFVGNSFGRYMIEWTPWRIIIMILFWKGTLIWGGFAILYLIITWYLGVLYNTLTRLHHKYKLLLNKNDILQSDVFIFMNGLFVLFIFLRRFIQFEDGEYPSLIVTYFSMILIGISYFEIRFREGKKQFIIFLAIWIMIVFFVASYPFALIGFSTLALLIYSFLFTLNIAFK